MKLAVKKPDGTVEELAFREGPISIGRGQGSHILLSDVRVSRQHAVIYISQAGVWTIEDLGSSNKTILNDNAVHKSHLKHGDTIAIADFRIEVFLEEKPEYKPRPTGHMEDTLTSVCHDVEIHVRNLTGEHAAPLHIPARRLKDLQHACCELCKASSLYQLHQAILLTFEWIMKIFTV